MIEPYISNLLFIPWTENLAEAFPSRRWNPTGNLGKMFWQGITKFNTKLQTASEDGKLLQNFLKKSWSINFKAWENINLILTDKYVYLDRWHVMEISYKIRCFEFVIHVHSGTLKITQQFKNTLKTVFKNGHRAPPAPCPMGFESWGDQTQHPGVPSEWCHLQSSSAPPSSSGGRPWPRRPGLHRPSHLILS